MKKVLSILVLLFSIISFTFAGNEGGGDVEVTTITINRARETNYKKDEETGNDVIVLEGAVELSVEKGSSISYISADKITYDRATEMLYGEGNVSILTKDSSSGGENITANSLLLNTSTLEGVFDGGKVMQTKSDALNLPSGSTLIVFSDAFGKGNNNVIAFKNSSLTFCEDENPHWHIDATRTWLLPGGEFAFFNALLYVGPVPVMYFPAFYYPKDQLVFNPVFSFREREGYSIQTTTYLQGRKGLDENSPDFQTNSEDESKISSEALYSFMKPTSLKKQRLEGIMLHNLDEDFEGDTYQYLKVMADYYSNLGFFVGIDGRYKPSTEYITDLSFFLNLGFSNTIFQDNGKYYPFSSSGKKYKDKSTFLGMTLPFRYGANLQFTLSKPFSLSVSLPIYSDPYFLSDFKNNRSETMDWISFLLDNESKSPSNNGNNEISSFSWDISASYNPVLPEIVKPYINSLSLSLNSSVYLSSKYAEKLQYDNVSATDYSWGRYTPLRSFYYPSLIKPVQFNVNLSGDLFSWPRENPAIKIVKRDYPIELNKPDDFKTKKELEAEKEKDQDKNNLNEELEIDKNDDDKKFSLYFPELEASIPAVNDISGLYYDLSYSFKTDFNTQIGYSSSNLKTASDFNWNNVQSFMYTLNMPLTITSSLKYCNDFFTMNNTILYNPLFQKHPYISKNSSVGGYSDNEADSLILADYKSEKQDIVSQNSIIFKPFIFIPMFKNTRFALNTNIKLLRNDFIGTVKNPLWETKFLDFTDEKSITENNFSLNVVASQLEDKFSQDFQFSYIIPPLLSQFNFKLNLKFPYVSTSFETGLYETTRESVNNSDKWKVKPFSQSLSVSLFNSSLQLSESFSYNIEKNRAESLHFSSSWKGLNISFAMANVFGYDFDKKSGWKMRSKEEFLPTSLSVNYNLPDFTFKFLDDKIVLTPTLNTSVYGDLIRPTNSYLLFSPGISLNITDFLTFKFSATSKNSVLYWYFHNNPGDLYSDWGGFPGNVVKDLFDSFRFDNSAIREGSGFKLKSLNFELEHDLHDWKFNMALKFEPRVITENGIRRYDFNPYFSISIVWKPMESLKTEIIDDYGKWELR